MTSEVMKEIEIKWKLILDYKETGLAPVKKEDRFALALRLQDVEKKYMSASNKIRGEKVAETRRNWGKNIEKNEF